jgi:outer membrane lipoprotein-sorting protein
MALSPAGTAMIVTTTICAAVALQAQQPTTNAAADALTRMEAAYKALPALHIKVRSSAKYSGGMSAEDFPLPGPDSLELRMERPNKLYMSSVSKRDGKSSSYLVVSDGTTLTYWRSSTNSYIQKKAPATLGEIAALLPDDAIGVTIDGTWENESIAEWDLLVDVGTSSIMKTFEDLRSALTLTGPEKLGGAQVNVVRLAIPRGALPFEMEQRFYLDAESYLLRGFAASSRGKHPETGRDFTVEMRELYDLHTTQPNFGPTAFQFVAPRGAKPQGPAR